MDSSVREEVVRLRNEIVSISRNLGDLRQQLRELVDDNMPKAAYEHEVKFSPVKDKLDTFDDPVMGFTETFVVVSRLTNRYEFEEFKRVFGEDANVTIMPDESSRRSVRYYRLHGTLHHTSGGYITLTDKAPCTDEEWEEIRAGKIPSKLFAQWAQ